MNTGMLRRVCLVACVIVIATCIVGCEGPEGSSEGLTLENYNAIKAGMSYDDVVNIIGRGAGRYDATATPALASWVGQNQSIYVWFGAAGANAKSCNLILPTGETFQEFDRL